jgi:glycosyltransferase involved in cell wall biosynthesis
VYIPEVDSLHAEILAIKRELDKGKVSEHFHRMVEKLETHLMQHLADVDVLIAHNVCSLNKNLPLTAALFEIFTKAVKPRFILWHHDLAWTTPRYQTELHEGHPWELLKIAWDGAVQVTISNARQRELAELLNIDIGRVAVIPNGVDVEKFFKFESQTHDFVEKLDLLQASPLLLLPVRITPRKNIELALRVLFHLRKKLPFVKLVVTGPLGPHNPANVHYFERLRALHLELGLTDAAHFLAELANDYIPDAVISDFYRMADAMFLPSIEEGFGIPIIEAGIFGIPIFCSDISPFRELAGDHANYFSLEDDPNVIASMLFDHLMKDKMYTLRSKTRLRYSWLGIYESRIEPLLREQREGKG